MIDTSVFEEDMENLDNMFALRKKLDEAQKLLDEIILFERARTIGNSGGGEIDGQILHKNYCSSNSSKDYDGPIVTATFNSED